MYLWKVDSLVADFKSDSVSQKEELKYMILSTIMMLFISDPLFHIDSPYTIYDAVSSILLLAISVCGTYCCYKINAAGDNKDLIARLMCIGLPAVIRVLVIALPILILLGIIVGILSAGSWMEEPRAEAHAAPALELAWTVLVGGTYYFYLARKIKAVSS